MSAIGTPMDASDDLLTILDIADLEDALAPRPRRSRKFVPSDKVESELIERAAGRGVQFGERVNRRPADVRKSFVRRAPAGALPPSVRLLRTSDASLKLYLTFLWLASGSGSSRGHLSAAQEVALAERDDASKPTVIDADAGRARVLPLDPHTVSNPVGEYADLFGFSSPFGEARQATMRRSIDALATERLIWCDRRNGVPPIVQLRKEDRSGDPYRLPFRRASSPDGSPDDDYGKHFLLPASLWTNGWMALLSGRAIATLLALIVQRGTNAYVNPTAGHRWDFVAPSIRDKLYGLSEDTFGRGSAELEAYRLIRRRSGTSSSAKDRRRRPRHEYQLRLDRLATPAFEALNDVRRELAGADGFLI